MNQNDYIKMNHCDILWVDDFDKISNDGQGVDIYGNVSAFDIDNEEYEDSPNNMPDTNDYSKQKDNYFPQKYHFRIDIYKYLHKLFLHLEENFSQYTCAVLDVNFQDGFGYTKDKYNEKAEVIKKLEHYNIIVKNENFDKNAGYYIYLYLLQRGMPADRICMLTANDSDTSEKWNNLFKNAGLKAPNPYNRFKIKEFYNAKRLQEDKDSLTTKGKPNKENEAENERFQDWLNKKVFTKEHRFRSCVVAISGCLLNMIENNGIKLRKLWDNKEFNIDSCKYILHNLNKIPLRFSDKEIEYEYANIIWQLVNPWEEKFKTDGKSEVRQRDNNGKLNYDYIYYNLLKTTRNCLAHRHFEKLDLFFAAFLFGLSLRGLFDFTNIDNSVKDIYEEYKKWEDELLELLKEIDDENNDFNFDSKVCFLDKKIRDKKDFSWLVLQSFQNINERVRNIKKENRSHFSFNADVSFLIRDAFGKEGNINLTDLLRSFMHGIYPIYVSTPKENINQSNDLFTCKLCFKLDEKYKSNSEEDEKIGKRYLESIRKTLQKSIEDKL